MKGICPWCGYKSNRIAQHVLTCKHIPKELTKEEIKFKTLEFNLGKETINFICNDYLNLSSLPELRDKYKLDFKNIQFILKQCNIVLRTMSESQQKITKNKIKNTLKEKYGENIVNVSQLESTKEKVRQTFIKHYGVDNIWKTKEYAEFTSKRWASYSNERKTELINKWTKSEGHISKLENKIVSLLNDLNIPIETQFKFPKYFHKYDILIKGTNIIIEVQGDFWHANPDLYNDNDLLNFPNGLKYTAKFLWEKDQKNIDYANNQNYIVIQIWENDIHKYEQNNELTIFLLDLLNKYI